MKILNLIIFALALGLSLPACAAGKPSTQDMPAMQHGGHDHAAMMRGMNKPAAWTLYPTLKARMSGDNRESMNTVIMPRHIVAGSIDAWSNNLKDDEAHRQLAMEMGGAMLDKPDNGGFHWLSAREERGDMVRIASIVQPFGERGAKDPTAMFMQQKYELEIIPQPFPREHSRYRANEDWKFLVRYNGKPLPGQTVYLETSNGSMSEFKSDANGVLSIHVPDDFKSGEENKQAGGHNHGKPGAELVLATEYVDGGKTYLTAFNSSYGPNAFDQRSMIMGVGFTLLGMLGAVPLLRQRKNGKNGEA
jgi:hypothetical protein